MRERQKNENFQEFIQHIGKKKLRAMLTDFMKVPSYDDNSSFYTDWGNPREFTMGDMSAGECAGEIVSLVQFDMATAENMIFEAQLKLDDCEYALADDLAYRAMLQGAKALIKTEFLDISEDPDILVKEFRKRFYETKLFQDKYAGGKFAQYLFRRHAFPPTQYNLDHTRQLVEEAQLFIEASYACQDRITEKQAMLSSLNSS